MRSGATACSRRRTRRFGRSMPASKARGAEPVKRGSSPSASRRCRTAHGGNPSGAGVPPGWLNVPARTGRSVGNFKQRLLSGGWAESTAAVQTHRAKRGVRSDARVERAVCDLFQVGRGFDTPESGLRSRFLHSVDPLLPSSFALQPAALPRISAVRSGLVHGRVWPQPAIAPRPPMRTLNCNGGSGDMPRTFSCVTGGVVWAGHHPSAR